MNRVYSVKEINKYVKGLLENDMLLSNIFIKGEISNLRKYQSGHIYLTLKDADAAVSAVIFKGNADNLTFCPKDGDFVVAYGYVTLYEKNGSYQLYIMQLEAIGSGGVYAYFEMLKKKLSDEGLFLSEHKKSLPQFPEKIAIVTSENGAVIKDIINVAGRRNKNVELFLFPAQVQGEKAPASIISALKKADGSDADIIILARGGGSFEDLSAFNDEQLARTIFSLKKPIVSAIGHETDYTIADFVSDLRAPTPSAAAELCIPLLHELNVRNEMLGQRIKSYIENMISDRYERLSSIMASPVMKKPETIVNDKLIYLDELSAGLYLNIVNKFDNENKRINMMAEKLNILSPENVLKRGYSITYNENNEIVKNANSLNDNDKIHILLAQGEIGASVTEIKQ